MGRRDAVRTCKSVICLVAHWGATVQVGRSVPQPSPRGVAETWSAPTLYDALIIKWMERVLLALSGGVDSSTAAVLLKSSGYEVVGCTMQLWDARRNPAIDGRPRVGRCCSLDDVYDARRVAEQLGFPFYVLNFEEQFEKRVVEPFISQYLRGQTPIPCTLCNTFLKFDELLSFGKSVGIDKIATGHYARTREDADEGLVLLKGVDENKDQSYYLFELSQKQLASVLFPVGEYRKPEIRAIALREGLNTAGKPDSQEICFVPDGDYAAFIRRHTGEVDATLLPVLNEREKPGPVYFKDGTQLGTHLGIHRFTIGQRRGLGIAYRSPLYVLRLDLENNAVIVGLKEDAFRCEFVANRVNWISNRLPGEPVTSRVKIRSNHLAAPATVTLEKWDSSSEGLVARVRFDEPQLAVTPGQAAVFYQGERVLGGGWIATDNG